VSPLALASLVALVAQSLPSLPSLPSLQPIVLTTMAVAQYISDSAERIRALCLEDPFFIAVQNGSSLWGDIMLREDALRSPVETIEVVIDPIASLPGAYEGGGIHYGVTRNPAINTGAWARIKSLDVETAPVMPEFTLGIKTIIVRNLPRDVTTHDLDAIFKVHGAIKDIYIPKNMDKTSQYYGTVKGFALVKFLSPQSSANAYRALYGRLSLRAKDLTIEFASQDR
jgi:hypothetical protein